MKFNFQQLASAGTGYLIGVSETDNGIGGVYEVLNFMTGDNLFTHVLPRAFKQCSPVLEVQFPWLKTMRETIELSKTQCKTGEWNGVFVGICEHYRESYGDSFEPIPLLLWQRRNPLEELADMVGEDKIIVVETEGETTC